MRLPRFLQKDFVDALVIPANSPTTLSFIYSRGTVEEDIGKNMLQSRAPFHAVDAYDVDLKVILLLLKERDNQAAGRNHYGDQATG